MTTHGHDAPERFALHVQGDGSVTIDIGHSFDEGDIAGLVAAQHDLARLIPRQRPALESAARR